MTIIIIVLIGTTGPVLLSLLIEAMRREPDEPAALNWAPALPVPHTVIDGTS